MQPQGSINATGERMPEKRQFGPLGWVIDAKRRHHHEADLARFFARLLERRVGFSTVILLIF
jgi:hypothetical protein